MTKLTWKKCGIEYYDDVQDFVEPYFEGVSDYPEAASAYQEIADMTAEEIMEKAGNPDYDMGSFCRDVVDTAYRAMWKFYEI